MKKVWLVLCVVCMLSILVGASSMPMSDTKISQTLVAKFDANWNGEAFSWMEGDVEWSCSFTPSQKDWQIVSIYNSDPMNYHVGLWDTKTATFLLAPDYREITSLPNGDFLLRQGYGFEEINGYLIGKLDGTTQALPDDAGTFVGVDADGYFTFAKSVEVTYNNTAYDGAPAANGTIYRQALLDSQYNLILDFVDEQAQPTPIRFQDGLAAVHIGGTNYKGSSKYGITSNAPAFLLDHSGNLVKATQLKGASSWSTKTLFNAIANDLVPVELQGQYQNTMTRSQFCALATSLYEAATQTEIAQRKTFIDTQDENVAKMAALGVVDGVGKGAFDPNGSLTREQAATILARLAGVLDYALPVEPATFQDNTTISTWAFDAVGMMQHSGIMDGIGDNTFAPSASYTIEQSITTAWRLFALL